MSAAVEKLVIEEKPGHADVRAALRRLSFRRRLFQMIARGTNVVACALAALCVSAFVDDKWLLPRTTRLAILLVILFAGFILLARAVWLLLRQRPLVKVARTVERAAGNNRNALVTLVESFESVQIEGTHLYMLARLERQARVELSKIDERVVA